MYRNLVAEMARHGVTKVKIADVLGIHYNTILEKMNGNQNFTLREAACIRKEFFPDLDFEYLFAEIFKEREEA